MLCRVNLILNIRICTIIVALFVIISNNFNNRKSSVIWLLGNNIQKSTKINVISYNY